MIFIQVNLPAHLGWRRIDSKWSWYKPWWPSAGYQNIQSHLPRVLMFCVLRTEGKIWQWKDPQRLYEQLSSTHIHSSFAQIWIRHLSDMIWTHIFYSVVSTWHLCACDSKPRKRKKKEFRMYGLKSRLDTTLVRHWLKPLVLHSRLGVYPSPNFGKCL